MTTAAQLLAEARRHLGVVEAANGSNPFGRQYGTDRVAWCAQFTWACFQNVDAGALHPKTAYTPTLANWFRNAGRFGTQPRVGALVFFDWKDSVKRIQHVGIVEAVETGAIVTIEGNTSSGTRGSQDNGGGVHRRRRSLAGIVGYGYPDYADVRSTDAPQVDVSVARALQAAVHVTVDGQWGPRTDGALALVRRIAFLSSPGDVRATQAAVGTKADGQWGPKSADALEATVRAVQGALGVGVDGVWGKNTDAAFQAARARNFRP